MDSVTLDQSADVVRKEDQRLNIALKIRTYHPSYAIDNPEGHFVLPPLEKRRSYSRPLRNIEARIALLSRHARDSKKHL